MKKTVLVTGGAGFIGSHLCERLRNDGHRVISLDNYFAGSKENHVEGVEYREGHTKDIAQHVPETPDIIYHLGEYGRVAKSIEEPELVFDLNIAGTFGVLEFWRTRGGKLVYAGSSTKFASSQGTDGTQGSELSPYTWAKATNVTLVGNYARWYGLPHAIVYFYSVYGPNERAWGSYGTLIETFRQNLIAGTPHHINAPGTQTRAFTHVLDTVDGIVRVGEAGEGDGYSISAKEVYSVQEVADMFGGEVIMDPQTKTSRSSVADDTAKIEALGWKQQHTLPDYIKEAKQLRA